MIPKEGILIRFTEAEYASIVVLAKAFQANKRHHGVQTKKFDPNFNDYEVQLIGLKGEVAVAKLLGVSVDRRLFIGGDTGEDLKHRGLTIQVKTARPSNTYEPDLAINDSKSLKCDLLVRCTTDVETPAVRVNGWIRTIDFLQAAKIKNYGYGDRMTLPVSDLNEAHTLKQYRPDDLVWEDVASRRKEVVITDEFFDIWQERSAIMENDGGLSRARADLQSFKELVNRR